MKDNIAKPIIFPLPSNDESTFCQFRKNVFMPFMQVAHDLVEDGLRSLKTEKILVCGDACWVPNAPNDIFFKIHLNKEKAYIYVVELSATLYELPIKYQLAGALGFTFKLCDDKTVKPNIDGEQKAVMARDFVWGE